MNDVNQITAPKLLELPTDNLLQEFGAGQPTPGSGSAACLMGLLSASLIVTVCKKSIKKWNEEFNSSATPNTERTKIRKDIKQFKEILTDVENNIVPELKKLFESDSDLFQKVVEYRNERDRTEDRIKKRQLQRKSNDKLEKTNGFLQEAIKLCLKLGEYGLIVFDSGLNYIRGDSGVAISSAFAGVLSGIFVLNLNVKVLKKRKTSPKILKYCEESKNSLIKLQDQAFKRLYTLRSEAAESLQISLPEI